MSKEEFELGYRDWTRRQCIRAAVICLILIAVASACSIAAYRLGWSFAEDTAELRSYREEIVLAAGDTYKPIHNHLLYIGVFSPPGNFEKRQLARHRWIRELQAATFPGGSVKLEFLIGQVPIQGNNVSKVATIATERERSFESHLQQEANAHGDIHRIPVADSEIFDSAKVLWLLSKAVSWRSRFVIKTVDDQVVMVADALKKLQTRPPTQPPTYFGKDWDPASEAEADGKRSWFYHRKCYGISGDLAYRISETHFNHSIAFPMYGSTRDDVNVAKWVQFEDNIRKQANILPVERTWMPNLCKALIDWVP